MAHSCFFSWQLDTPANQNKAFILEALKQATSEAGSSATVEVSPRIESGTDGVAGNPNIIETIFSRIRRCAFFVADVTIIATSAGGKAIPNPNVMVELGYAARSIGWNRTIFVFNGRRESCGRLPFDILQNRWPITYEFDGSPSAREPSMKSLSRQLKTAISACEEFNLNRADEMASSLDVFCLETVMHYESIDRIPFLLPTGKPQHLSAELSRALTIRHLLAIGAVELHAREQGGSRNKPGYWWTYDGRKMIESIHRMHPGLKSTLRENPSNTHPKVF